MPTLPTLPTIDPKALLIRAWPHLASIAFFYLIVSIYFYPSVFENKVVRQPDIEQAAGMSQEMREAAKTAEPGEIIAWSGALFSGMPNYVIYAHGFQRSYVHLIDQWVKELDYLGASMVLTGLLSFYILMLTLGARPVLAVTGAIAFAFASYNIIIIEAGHVNKAYVIGVMPLTIAGMIRLFNQDWLKGFTLFLLGSTLSISNNHTQITYYLMLLGAVMFIGHAIQLILAHKAQALNPLGKTLGLLVLGALLAVLPSIGTLYATWEMGKTSLRGPSELTITPESAREGAISGKGATSGAGATSDSPTTTPAEGLDIDYAFMWSYGAKELLTTLIPNAYGGASGGTLDSDSNLYKELRSRGARVGQQVQTYTYWGDKPFTSGPVYFGAVVCFLFVFGMVYLRERVKWPMLAGAIFLTLLALGQNFMLFNELMFDFLPLYNKFRTPEMALVIPGLIVPIIGFWGLQRYLRDVGGATVTVDSSLSVHSFDLPRAKKALLWALGVTAGLSALVWIAPNLLLDFRSPADARYDLPDWYYTALLADRSDLARQDALRSLLFVLAAAATLYGVLMWRAASPKSKGKKVASRTPNTSTTLNPARTTLYATLALATLVLVDLWTVDRRYLDETNFTQTRPEESFTPTIADQAIFADAEARGDTQRAYRVLNLNGTFSDNHTPYFHRSVGGYHPAKLRRYQDLIDFHLTPEINRIIQGLQTLQPGTNPSDIFKDTPVLNMLNTRYVIYNPEQPPLFNPYAMGEAWFVEQIREVGSADEEIIALGVVDLYNSAIVRSEFHSDYTLKIGHHNSQSASDSIRLVSYKPHAIRYAASVNQERLVILSEVFYENGWKLYVNGDERQIFRLNWNLRGLVLKNGDEVVELIYSPDDIANMYRLGRVLSLLIIILIAFLIYKYR